MSTARIPDGTPSVSALDARIRLLPEVHLKGALLMMAHVMPGPVADALDQITAHDEECRLSRENSLKSGNETISGDEIAVRTADAAPQDQL